MQVSVERTGTLGRKLLVQVPSREIEDRVSGKIQDLGRQVRLKGFRPGKVPLQVLQQRYGKRVRQEVVGELIQESFQQAVVRENLRPASQPEIDTQPPQPDQDLHFTASFDVLPELEDVTVSDIEIERAIAEVGDQDINEMIETLRAQRRSWENVEREAREGDLVFFHFSLEHEGGRFPTQGEERAAVVMGSQAFDAALESALVGCRVGDERQAAVTLNADFREASLAGVKVTAALRVEKVQQSRLPEVNDEFFASFGVEKGGEVAFRADVRANMERELKQVLERRLHGQVIDKLVAAFPDMEVPQAMVETESDALHRQTQQRLQQMGKDTATAPAAKDLRVRAEQRVRAALLVNEIVRHGDLQADAGRVRDLINEVASTYEDPQAVINMYYSDQNLLNNVTETILREKAVEWVVARAKVTDKKLNFGEVMRPDGSS